jgi:hypothetical protein
MSDRTLKQLVGALTVAVGVWLISSLLSSGAGGIAASGEIASLFDDLDGPSLTAVRIEGAAGSVDLERGPDGWTANGYRTSQSAVTTFLSAVTAASIGDLVAANPSNHERMGVDEGSALHVIFTTESGSRSVLLGQSGRRFQTSYVRTPGADEVYLLEGRLGSELRKDESAWRDLTMATVDTVAVARIVVSGDRDYTLVRGDTAWTLEGGAAVEPSTVNGILAELSNLAATGFYAESDSVAQLPLAFTAEALAADGSILAEVTIGAGERDRWGRVASDDYLYRVSAFRAERLGPERSALLGGG